ncbi:Lipoprotein releasing system ATP-binding protein LolD [hydrothermal vent metagenome]|uniref:Lipoprotein releasing system ATP-binding protein LolD n=1 Tax=hydrothermal vent metagenome TaxID=652676 RepID=A0A1W1BNV8_9ZZZZ
MNIIECQNISKEFVDSDIATLVLKDINLTVKKNETIAILGSSGSGKSTLLNILAGIETPSKGNCLLMGENLSKLNETKICQLRNKHLGFIYQFHHLMPEFSAIENVAYPLIIQGIAKEKSLKLSKELLEKVNLAHRLFHKPNELSGGERQRIAICRALITKPSCILADEPTGNLDSKNANECFDLMFELNKINNCALIVVTHDNKLASRMDKIITLENGYLF